MDHHGKLPLLLTLLFLTYGSLSHHTTKTTRKEKTNNKGGNESAWETTTPPKRRTGNLTLTFELVRAVAAVVHAVADLYDGDAVAVPAAVAPPVVTLARHVRSSSGSGSVWPTCKWKKVMVQLEVRVKGVRFYSLFSCHRR